jgi:hypothetical protein
MNGRHFTVRLTSRAEKDILRLRPWADRVAGALQRLEDEPQAGHVLHGSLAGVRSLELTLRGSGAFRAAYVVLEESRECLVFLVASHERFYEKAERRARAHRVRRR